MILIYSKDIDDFVNQVIDCLDEDFLRIGDFDNLDINDIVVSQENDLFEVSYPFFKTSELKNIESIWFNGGYVCNKETEYENDCYQMLIETYLNNKEANKIGRLVSKFEVNKLDVIIEAKKQGFKIPDTLFTEDKEKLILFYKKYNEKNGIICKRITDRYHYRYDDDIYNFNLTFLIDSQILSITPKKFAVSLFQERILADFEIRVIYIKGNIFAMSIHSFDEKTEVAKPLK